MFLSFVIMECIDLRSRVVHLHPEGYEHFSKIKTYYNTLMYSLISTFDVQCCRQLSENSKKMIIYEIL